MLWISSVYNRDNCMEECTHPISYEQQYLKIDFLCVICLLNCLYRSLSYIPWSTKKKKKFLCSILLVLESVLQSSSDACLLVLVRFKRNLDIRGKLRYSSLKNIFLITCQKAFLLQTRNCFSFEIFKFIFLSYWIYRDRQLICF